MQPFLIIHYGGFMHRAKCLRKISKFFDPETLEEMIKEQYSDKDGQEFYERYGFYPYELWNTDYTFLCFVYTRCLAYYESGCCKGNDKEFVIKLKKLIKRSRKLINSGYDIWNDAHILEHQKICKKFCELVPSMWM